MKEDKILNWLKEKQEEIQVQYAEMFKDGKGYDHRGVWISVNCGCGHEYRTPFCIRPNATCVECNKKIWTFQKVKDSDK